MRWLWEYRFGVVLGVVLSICGISFTDWRFWVISVAMNAVGRAR